MVKPLLLLIHLWKVIFTSFCRKFPLIIFVIDVDNLPLESGNVSGPISSENVQVPCVDNQAIADVNAVSTNRRSSRKRERMVKELASLNEDNAGKSERDRMAIWRKLQKYISRNDDIANEYV